ncbi:MAG: hypothetical protein DHS20C16_21500 [Phycisphaerae bacterium]|nr:MAG: hypothetical protein DHS20C16_21500 [Phycisphaerae bacterium]
MLSRKALTNLLRTFFAERLKVTMVVWLNENRQFNIIVADHKVSNAVLAGGNSKYLCAFFYGKGLQRLWQ